MTVGESVHSPDGLLKVTQTAFDPDRGIGQLRLEELGSGRGWFYVTAKFAKGGQHRIDYKTFDVYKTEMHSVQTINRGDEVASIEILPIPVTV